MLVPAPGRQWSGFRNGIYFIYTPLRRDFVHRLTKTGSASDSFENQNRQSERQFPTPKGRELRNSEAALFWVSRIRQEGVSRRKSSSKLNHAHAMQVPYELKESPIAGLGLFATAPIARGTLLWKYDENSVKEYEEPALRSRLAPLSAAEAVELCEHVFCWEGKVCEIVDDGKYWNHAKGSNQNTGGWHPDGDAHGDGMSSYALRDIAAGEELTDDYALYDKLPWFEAICQEREVTGSCTQVGRQFD